MIRKSEATSRIYTDLNLSQPCPLSGSQYAVTSHRRSTRPKLLKPSRTFGVDSSVWRQDSNSKLSLFCFSQ